MVALHIYSNQFQTTVALESDGARLEVVGLKERKGQVPTIEISIFNDTNQGAKAAGAMRLSPQEAVDAFKKGLEAWLGLSTPL